jgi:hypothetical protein
LKKALESKGYAAEFYPTLEDYKGQSLFDAALDIGINAARRKGLDPTIFERWKATRATKAFTADEDEDEEELNLESLTDALLAEGADKPATAVEPAATVDAGADAGTPADAEATA